MTSVLRRFDRWTDSGPFTADDLGAYRIVFAVVGLLTVRDLSWVSAYPDSLFDPPPGPFVIFSGFPPHAVAVAIDVALSVALVALAIGYRTTAASITTSSLVLLVSGFSYSLGKIDHNVFFVLVPSVLALARWGDALSVDAVLVRRRGAAQQAVGQPARPPQWPLRLLALLIGLGFVTAAVPKVISGWLDPSSQAVRAVLGRQYDVYGRTELLAPYAVQVDVPVLWELFDISAVTIELAIIVTVPWWRAFRAALACAALFHVGVFLIMNITFAGNVLVYGAFLPTGAALARVGAHRGRGDRTDRWSAQGIGRRWPARRLAGLAAVGSVVGGLTVWWARQTADPAHPTAVAVLAVGGVVAAWTLVRQVARILPVAARPRRPARAVSRR